MRRCLAISYGRRIDQVAVFILPGDRVVTQMRCVGRLVGRVPNDFCDFGTPARKGVGIFICFRLGRIIRLRNVCRFRAVAVRGCFLQHGRPVFVHEGHVVLIHCAVVGRGVGCVFGHIRNRRTPASKGVGIFIRFRLGRIIRLRNLCRCRAVVVRGCFLQDCRSVFVHEGHVVLIHCAAVGRLVGRVPGDFCDRGAPARKGVGVLIRRSLGRISRLLKVCRAVVVFRRADFCTVFVREGYGILPFCSGVGRGVGRVFGHFRNRRTPARKGVGVFIRRSLGRISRLHNVFRCRAVVIFRRAGFCTIFVREGYRILPFCSGIGCLVGRVPGHFRDRGAPARKGVGILGGRSLGRISRFYNVCRCRAVVVRDCFLQDCRSVFIHEGHGVLVNYAVTGRGIGRLIGCVPGDLRDHRAPAREGVGIFIRRSLGRISRLQDFVRCRAVVIFRRADSCSVFVLEGYDILPFCRGIGRLVGRVPGDDRDRRAPAREGVGIFIRSRLGRIIRLHNLFRCRAVVIIRRADFRPVVVHEGHGVPVDCVVVSRGVGRIPGDFCDRGAPARKGVGIMSGRSLGRISRLHDLVRFRAVGVFRRADFCTVFVHEGYRMILIPLGDRIYIVFRNDGRGFDLLSLSSSFFFSFFCIIHEPGPGTGHAFLRDRIIPGNHASGFQCVAGKQYEMVTFFIIEGDRAGFRLRT